MVRGNCLFEVQVQVERQIQQELFVQANKQ
jgi:hypothetical protein